MADIRERWNDQEEATRLAVDRHLGTIWTALPVKVLEDSEGHVCKLQATIKGWQRSKDDGALKAVDIPHFGEVPVTYAQGGGFIITHPVKKDDEGIAIFASRCIDGWWDKGDIQEEPYRRRHSLSDALYIPGVRSNPRKIGGDDRQQQNGQQQQRSNGGKEKKKPSTNSVQIRTEDGEYYIELTSEDVNIVCKNCTVTAEEYVKVKCKNAEVEAEENIDVKCKNITVKAEQDATVECRDATIKASDKITLDTPLVEITGRLRVRGEITGTGRSLSLSTHTHMNVQGGLGISGPPTAGS